MVMPAFDPPLRFARPRLPSLSCISVRLEKFWNEGYVTKGPLTPAYEEALSEYLGVGRAVAVSSCTTGLILALQALKLEGDCLIPSFTFTSTAQALLWNKLKPVFIDIHPTRFTATVQALEDAFTLRTSCVLVPYVFGNPPPVQEIESFCRRKKLVLIFDAAHAFGTLLHGKPPGGSGNAEVFSTSATKLLCTGEGGVVATNDRQVADALTLLREYGHDSSFETSMQGLNGRLTDFQAAMGLEGLPLLEDHAKQRNKLADLYKQAFRNLPVSFQEIEPDCRSSYKDFAVLLGDEWHLTRDHVATQLEREGIPTRKYFSPLHQQAFFVKTAGMQKPLPTTENISNRILCFPVFYHLTDNQIEKVAKVFSQIFMNQKRVREQVS